MAAGSFLRDRGIMTEGFRLVVIDPPWKYASRANDPTHRARNQYADMTLDEINALPVPELAHADCVVFLWTTNAFAFQALEVLDAWAFSYGGIITWVKDHMGLGDWLRGQTEHCLMGIRGKPIMPALTLEDRSGWFEAPLRRHSRKPEEFYALVESAGAATN